MVRFGYHGPTWGLVPVTPKTAHEAVRFELSDPDSREDDTIAMMARLVDELQRSNVLPAQAIARILGNDWQVEPERDTLKRRQV